MGRKRIRRIIPATILDAYRRGELGLEELSKSIGVCRKVVRQLVVEHGVAIHPPGAIAGKHSARVDRSAIDLRREWVRRMREDGLSYREIGDRLGISHQRAAQIHRWEQHKETVRSRRK